jgi:hypothetical protein
MITEIIRDRIVKASLEISNARDSVRHVLNTIADDDVPQPMATVAGTPVNPHGLSLSRATDLLEAEVSGLQRELMKFRGDESEQSTAVDTRRYK